ncbi:Mad3/BUB1 homology region 1 [Backusella circina FSU 941]|nr:Mad3/BUB1 homology region 1 [Backusella circina FSU 941]
MTVPFITNDQKTREHNRKRTELKEGHLEFKRKLEHFNELDDPLAAYLEYIDWIKDHYPQGNTKDSNLLPILKTVTESFIGNLSYKHEFRYLKVCLKYAKWIKNPETIYRFLMTNEIGQNLALFYEEHADFLEKKL